MSCVWSMYVCARALRDHRGCWILWSCKLPTRVLGMELRSPAGAPVL